MQSSSTVCSFWLGGGREGGGRAIWTSAMEAVRLLAYWSLEVFYRILVSPCWYSAMHGGAVCLQLHLADLAEASRATAKASGSQQAFLPNSQDSRFIQLPHKARLASARCYTSLPACKTCCNFSYSRVIKDGHFSLLLLRRGGQGIPAVQTASKRQIRAESATTSKDLCVGKQAVVLERGHTVLLDVRICVQAWWGIGWLGEV